MGVLNKASARMHGAVDDIADAAAPVEDQDETLSDSSQKLLESAGKYVAAHPLQSLALAFAAGYLISRMAR
jgi:ElaB/YqjD/DUF883 family membrane-anchored ribosome-binding protein